MKKKSIFNLALAMICLSALIAPPTAHAQTYGVIHTFTGGGDGANPEAGVTYKAGLLYGTAYRGGVGNGSVYQMMKLQNNNWFTQAISIFSSGGANPRARAVFGPDGHLYGTTQNGPFGIVFNLIPPLSICKTANCFWKENVFYTFTNGVDGVFPGYGDLLWDSQHNIYGTVQNGGGANDGTVYELTCSGSNCTENTLYTFSGPDGAYPLNGVIPDATFSNLFGTTWQGGLHSDGEVFQLTKFGITWLETNAYNFQNADDGRYPYAGVVMDSSGDLFGAASDGGVNGGGTVFELIPSGDTYDFKLLYTFTGQAGNSCGPRASLTLVASTGDLYGTTYCDGTHNDGNVFKLSNTQSGWVYTDLYDFTGGNDGANPISNVTIGDDGNLYGTASMGGSQGVGVVWQIKP